MKPMILEGKIEEINLKNNYLSLTYLDYASFNYLDKVSCEELDIDLNKHKNLKKQIENSKLKKGETIKLKYRFEENKVDYFKIQRHSNPKRIINELEKISQDLNFF